MTARLPNGGTPESNGRDPGRAALRAFGERFGAPPPLLVRAPGRVNLIGEHTDYNDGWVLPMAIDRALWIALRPRSDQRVVLQSLDFGEEREFDLDDLQYRSGGWIDYVQGIAWALRDAGHPLRGWEGVAAGNVPMGAGLSSSAALELATLRAFAAVADIPWDPRAMARVGQHAEIARVGVNTGIMDQMISATGEEGHALLIDCRTLDTESLSMPPGTRVVVMDTGSRRGLIDSAYNERRAQCEAAAAQLGAAALRDVRVAELERRADELEPVIRRRARHVVTENERTLQAAEALRRGDASRMGALMNASHASLRDHFEVSSEELDLMVELAQGQPGCYGARMTGAGFGGCAVALVEAAAAEPFAREVERRYRERSTLQPSLYICTATGGASLVAHHDVDGAVAGA